MSTGSLVLNTETSNIGIILYLCQEAWGRKRFCISWNDGRIGFEWENRLEFLGDLQMKIGISTYMWVSILLQNNFAKKISAKKKNRKVEPIEKSNENLSENKRKRLNIYA